MGQFAEPNPLDLIETGTEPEFVVTRIAKFDALPSGWVRLYLCAHRGDKNTARIEFTVVCSTEDLAKMSRHGMSIAAAAHNRTSFGLPLDS